jgi:fatty acid desaturase
MPQPVEVPYPRGYSAPAGFREAIHRLHRTSLARSLLAVVSDHLAIFALILAGLAAYRVLPLGFPGAVAVNLLALVGVGRFQRGLECMGHEASHYNWDRCNRGRNNLLGNALAALPVFATVGEYRQAHLTHHRRLGTREDPDLQRYLELDIEALDRTGAARFALGVARRLPRYLVSWWHVVGTSRTTVAKALAWHAVIVVLPLTLFAGPVLALAVWANWAIAFVVVLPVLRFVGEAAEHNYTGSGTLFEVTMINDGWIHRLLIHPHNDGLHLTHHLWPGVPHHQLRRLHRLVAEADPKGYAARIRCRTRLLEQPSAAAAGWSPVGVGSVRRSA